MFTLNNICLPSCAIGTWAWGAGMNGSKMVFGKNYSEEQLSKTFDTAYEQGFVLWDTAEVYGMGNSEKILGKCIKNRVDVILSTKYQPSKKFKQGKLEESLNNSLSRLGVDCVDLYWLHQPFCLEENITEAVEQLKYGKIKSLGLSNCTL
ncbi:MAG: aldo/keto reductase, partial [Ruminococcus sp.]|nr:aldo/keto reductase [Ruminococcus sp.]